MSELVDIGPRYIGSMPDEGRPPTPLALLVIETTVGHESTVGRRIPLARSVHPGRASLAATIWSGRWPEHHGVTRRWQPHVDRLGLDLPRPDLATGGSVWTAAASAGRRVAVCNWPHETVRAVPDGDGGMDMDRIGVGAIEGLAGDPPAVVPPGSVDPPARSDALRSSAGKPLAEVAWDGLRHLIEQQPDVLVAWLPDWVEDGAERLREVSVGLAKSPAGEAMLVVLEHPPVSDSVMLQSRGSARPRLSIHGPSAGPWPLRPRVDGIHDVVARAIGIERTTTTFRSEPMVGGTRHLDESGLPQASRYSGFDLKEHEHQRSLEIGASMVGRGLLAAARPWLMAALQTQHGRIDIAALVLLVRCSRGRGASDELERLHAGMFDRIPGPVHELIGAWITGNADAVFSDRGREVMSKLGPFLAETIMLDLRRRGCLQSRSRPGTG